MAIDELTISRRGILGGAVAAAALAAAPAEAQPGPRSEWDRNLAAYYRATALADADDSFGAYRRALENFHLETAQFEAQHGPREKQQLDPEAKRLRDEIMQRLTDAEEVSYRDYLAPKRAAARALAMTPAPDLMAALLKIEIIKEQDLDNDAELPREAMDLVAEDMARLAKGRA